MNYDQKSPNGPLDPYAMHPYSPNLPDQSDLESSQSIHDNQQHNPQSSNDPHQPVHMAYPSTFYAQDQAENQQHDIMVENSFLGDSERILLKMRIREIEKILDSGWYWAYKLWLVGNLIFSISGVPCLFSLVIELIVLAGDPQDQGTIKRVFILAIWLTWCIWLGQQCLRVKNAMQYMSLEGTRRGFRSMRWFSVYHLVTFIVFVWLCEGFRFERERLTMYVCLSVVLYTIPTFLRLFGAIKAISWLEKREDVVVELEKRYGYHGEDPL